MGRSGMWAFAGLGAIASFAGAAPPRYTVTIIEWPPLAQNFPAPRALNDQGWVTGDFGTTAFGDEYGYRTFLWRPGQGSIDIGQPGTLRTVLVSDISNEGEITGFAATSLIKTETEQQGYRWKDGQFVLSPHMVPGRPTEPSKMNDHGRIVGWANDGSFTGAKAVEFLPSGAVVQIIPEVSGYNWGIDINNLDQILGTEGRGVFRTTPGQPTFFLPPPSATLTGFHPLVLNDGGDVGGAARVAVHPEGNTAAVYLEGSGWRILPKVGKYNQIVSINGRREAVGNSRDNAGPRGDHGWYWTEQDGVVALEDLLEPAGAYGIFLAHDINERGQIAATGVHRVTGQSVGMLLTPIRCYSDFNGDGFVDGIDADQFNNAFEAGNPAADLNTDGFVDGMDYDSFNNAFEGGC